MSNQNLNASGNAKVNVGNMVSGDTVSIDARNQRITQHAQLSEDLLNAIREAAEGDEKRIAAVRSDVDELSHELTAEPADTGRIQKILDTIKNHNAWAFPAIAAVVAKALPALSAMLRLAVR